MIDMHCNLDLIPDVLKKIDLIAEKTKFILAVTTSPRAWVVSSKVFSSHKNIHTALGLHPEIIRQKFSELPLLIANIPNAMFIGEVGLDGTKGNRSTFQQQRGIFEEIIDNCSKHGGRIISAHSIFAVKETLSIIEKNLQKILLYCTGLGELKKSTTGLYHWDAILVSIQ